MKEKRNILIAFILNLSFSIFELVGGILTGSVAILSDALHDVGDSAGICIAFFMEKKSKKKPDNQYTYGYTRYSVLGSLFTTMILLIGSCIVVYNAVSRFISPKRVDYNGMILFAIVGVGVNFLAMLFTKDGRSLNQKAVNLHMLEDVLGWIVVLIGAIVMHFTNFVLLDPILSICVSLYIFGHAVKHFINTCKILLEKVPDGIDVEKIVNSLVTIEGVVQVHHLHVWSLDGQNHCATLHIVASDENTHDVKHRVRTLLQTFQIHHATIELEKENEPCHEKTCQPLSTHSSCHHHGRHH